MAGTLDMTHGGWGGGDWYCTRWNNGKLTRWSQEKKCWGRSVITWGCVRAKCFDLKIRNTKTNQLYRLNRFLFRFVPIGGATLVLLMSFYSDCSSLTTSWHLVAGGWSTPPCCSWVVFLNLGVAAPMSTEICRISEWGHRPKKKKGREPVV